MVLTRAVSLVLCLSIAGGCAASAPPPPAAAPAPVAVAQDYAPRAEKVPRTFNEHGTDREDPYYWMRDAKDERLLAYLAEENAYAQEQMASSEDVRKKLYAEMRARIAEEDTSARFRFGAYEYWWRFESGKQYSIHLRQKMGGRNQEEVILDENVLAEGAPFFDLVGWKVSGDGRLLAYGTDRTGDEHHTVNIRDLNTGKNLADELKDIGDTFVWAEDNKTLFYTTLDETNRPYKVFRHTLGETQDKDVMVHHEVDGAFYVGVTKSRSKRFIMLNIESQVSSEVRYLEAKSPRGTFRVVEARRPNIEYEVVDRGDRFYVMTNDEARNFRIMEAPINSPGRRSWKELLAHSEKIFLVGIEAFKDHLVIWERENGLPHVRVRPFAPKTESFRIPMDEENYAIWPSLNADMDLPGYRFEYSSLTTPEQTIEFDFKAKTKSVKHETPVLGGFDRTRYETRRIWGLNGDAQIPISVLHLKGMKKTGSAPVLLTGYGAYGASFDPNFQATWISLVDRGFIVAIAHVRGGSEMGRAWYEDGKLTKKENSFRDFIACAETLIEDGWTAKGRIAIFGRSAGGLLVGAATNMRPDLFGAVLADVPFVDVLSTMRDASLPLTEIEWDEWGNPNQVEPYRVMAAYSPYDNVKAQNYPPMLITGSFNDRRVSYWEPTKWAAKLRATRTDKNLLLLKMNMGAGHSGASGRYAELDEESFAFAFLLKTLEVPSNTP